MAARPVLFLSVMLACTGCNPREYVHWDPDISVAARRADSLPDGKSSTVRLVSGRTFEARNISFEGETLRWTLPDSGVVSTLLLSQVDTVRVRGERHTGKGALVGSLAGVPYLARAAWSCIGNPRCPEYEPLLVIIGVVTSAVGTALGAGFGWLNYKWLIFVP